jgi:polysaccharide biosynthesis/export protein
MVCVALAKNFEIGTKNFIFLGVFSLLVGCSANDHITNVEGISKGNGYQAEYKEKNVDNIEVSSVTSTDTNMSRCSIQPNEGPKANVVRNEEQFSPGDLVEVIVGSDEMLSGRYEVAIDGKIKVRGLRSILAFGRGANSVSNDIVKALIEANFYEVPPLVSVRLIDYGTVRAFVNGAVFEPGAVTLVGSGLGSINDTTRQQALGATSDARRLTRALQSAGGVRPDADLSRVTITHANHSKTIDLREAILGGRFRDDLILEGDEIHVPSRGCFQADLVRPSAVSPVGVKVYMSNLTEPANSNAQSNIEKDTREMRYGTRFLQTVVSMNCVGGSKSTNASRSAVLFSRNPITGKSVVIERNIEDLLRHADRDDYDPYILPNDALACYDSRTTDIIKIAQGFGIVVGSYILGRGL